MGAPKNADDIRSDADIIVALRAEVEQLNTDNVAFRKLANEVAETTGDLRTRLKNAERDLAGARTQRDEALLQVQRAMGYIDRIVEQEGPVVQEPAQPVYNYAPTVKARGPRLDDNRVSVPF